MKKNTRIGKHRRIRHFSCLYTQGIATLPVVGALSVLVVVIIIGLSTISFNEGVIAQGSVRGAKALNYAQTGAKDALIRIARNKNYSCPAPALPAGCYEIAIVPNGCTTDEGCARIVVDANTNPKTIIAEGKMYNHKRTIKVQVSFDAAANGEITGTQWTEMSN